jgi:tripartite-type tricarboxylate transporter receptor subunit TctC
MFSKNRLLCTLLIGIAAAMSGLFAPAQAQNWPQRPVRLIVPLGVGSGTDVAARMYAQQLSERWSERVIVENRPGADGVTGVTAFATANDDHSLLYSFTAPLTVYPLLHSNLGYDPARDVVPIAWAAENYIIIAASSTLGVTSLSELFGRARAEPGKLSYHGGAGAIPYIFAGFLKKAGIDMVSIPYRELRLAIQDLVEGRIHVVVTGITPLLPPSQAGKARLLAVTNDTHARLTPEIPTVQEAGYKELAFNAGTGFFGPRSLPDDVRERIARDVQSIASSPALADRLASFGQLARASTAKQFSDSIAKERVEMEALIKLLGVTKTP